MLAQTIFIIAMIAIFAASAIAGVAGVARSQTASAAKALIVPGVETALNRYERAIAATIVAQSEPSSDAALTAPADIAALNGATPWNEASYLEAPADGSALQIRVDVRPSMLSAPSCAGVGGGPDSAIAVQCSPFVQESRLALDITSDAGPLDANGTISPLAHGRYTVTLRLFAQPPYVSISGVKDATGPNDYHEGDTGGFGNAIGAFASPAPDDTTIHVVYQCTDGTGSCAASDPPPQDAPSSLRWSNGNGMP